MDCVDHLISEGTKNMSASTDVYLITGFLGSGKTTFLNRIIEAFPKDRKLMILMNEFGDIGVDGPLWTARFTESG